MTRETVEYAGLTQLLDPIVTTRRLRCRRLTMADLEAQGFVFQDGRNPRWVKLLVNNEPPGLYITLFYRGGQMIEQAQDFRIPAAELTLSPRRLEDGDR